LLQLIRIVQLLNLLDDKTFTCADRLSCQLEISRRTVIRDIHSLKDAGVAIESSGKGYRLVSSDIQSKLSLSGEDKFTLLAGLQLLIDTKDPSLQVVASRLATRLIDNHTNIAMIPSIKRAQVETGKVVSKLRRLRMAVWMRKAITFYYQKPSQGSDPEKRELEPLAVFFRRHAYYVVGRKCDTSDLRTYRVSRISRLKVTRITFKKDDFNLGEYLQNAFEFNTDGPIMDVEILFLPEVAQFVKELVWHPRQKIEVNSDGSVMFSLRVAVNSEIVRWILGYGSSCIVKKPQLLIDLVKEQVDLMKENYLGGC